MAAARQCDEPIKAHQHAKPCRSCPGTGRGHAVPEELLVSLSVDGRVCGGRGGRGRGDSARVNP